MHISQLISTGPASVAGRDKREQESVIGLWEYDRTEMFRRACDLDSTIHKIIL